ncbi:MAG: DDE transposase, partial [Candidatus Makaraimicrobium thalassicum]
RKAGKMIRKARREMLQYVRPMKRGKTGKDVEFGPKGALSHVDGFLFLDKFSHDNFSEAQTAVVTARIRAYENKFGKRTVSFTGDQLYGNRTNRKLMDELEIRPSFKPLGRRKEKPKRDRWYKDKQKERNRIEGSFGNGKEHYGLDRIRYHGSEGAEMWVRTGILGMNLNTALARM